MALIKFLISTDLLELFFKKNLECLKQLFFKEIDIKTHSKNHWAGEQFLYTWMNYQFSFL